MRILITGGCGYIGSVLVRYYLEKGHRVIVLDLLKRGSDGISEHLENPDFTLINGDFTSKLLPLTLEMYRPEVVIHLAAIVGDPACAKDPELATKTNFEGVKWLVEHCNKYDLKLFIASTCSVYGSNPRQSDENSEPNPLSHYARTKLQMEEFVRENSNNGILFRFGTMYGWSPNMRYDLVVNKLVQDAFQTGMFNVFDGTQYRPFLHPLDLAIFLESLFKQKLTRYAGEIFNLVSENLIMKELGILIERLIPTSRMIIVPEKEDDRTYSCRSFKAYSELGFSPQIRVRDGIQEIEKNLIKKAEEVKALLFSP